ALYEYVPQIKKEGAELLIIAGHFGQPTMEVLAPVAKELGISIIGGGHSHQRVNEMIDGVAIIEAGARMMHYGKIEVLFDTVADTVIKLTQELYKNEGGTPDPEIESIISYWRSKVDSSLSQVIGYVDQDINQSSAAMRNMIMDSWLEMFPSADVSMTNSGGIRQSILKGEITLEDIIGVMPFENNIVELDLTGSELIDCMGRLLVGGIATKTDRLLSDGTSIHPDSIYSVLTIDYLYSRKDMPFHKYDLNPEYTSTSYRQPVINWIKSFNTTADNSLDQYLDNKSRR
ncbi:MAG: bifunctional metallophosphatase/5'-nucleotidase, partial [Candidatus Marinimicrobia bacterium]|nr:bifunctional metallophosphatase/5'-nucleotidase [Candidatus Neomarinimicrobiota bacterium]